MRRMWLHIAVLATIIGSTEAADRVQALAPVFSRIDAKWAELPLDYQTAHRKSLDTYLALMTTTNGSAWNDGWRAFTEVMGPQFCPLYADVTEAQKVAEIYEVTYPLFEEKMAAIAHTMTAEVPTNAILFIQDDYFEGILQLRQQFDKERTDMIVLNPVRLVDCSYTDIFADRYSHLISLVSTSIFNRACNRVITEKNKGNSEFAGVTVIDGRVKLEGDQLMDSFAMLAMREVTALAPARPALFMPALRQYTTKVSPSWTNLEPAGLFYDLHSKRSGNASSTRLLRSWEAVMDAIALKGKPLHGELANSFDKSLHATVRVLDATGKSLEAEALLKLWDERLQTVEMVSSKELIFDSTGKLVRKNGKIVP